MLRGTTVSYTTLRARLDRDLAFGSSGATPALARALAAIGWRSVREPSPEELAQHLLLLVDECVHGHRDVTVLAHGIAAMLRDVGPLLDGGLPPVEAYRPAAEALLEHYVNDHGDTAPPDFAFGLG
jgi:hypothetical protein